MTWKHGRQTPDNNLMRFVAQRFPEPAKMLDIGSGEGANARELKLRGHAVHTVDKDPTTEPEFCERIEDCEFLPGYFDLIYDINTLCHVENPPFEKIKSWLGPTGVFFTIWPAKGTWLGVAHGKEYTRLVDNIVEMRHMLCFQVEQVWSTWAPSFRGDDYLESYIAVARP